MCNSSHLGRSIGKKELAEMESLREENARLRNENTEIKRLKSEVLRLRRENEVLEAEIREVRGVDVAVSS